MSIARNILTVAAVLCTALTPLKSQVTPTTDTAIELGGLTTQVALVPAGSASTTIDLLIDAHDPTGLVDIVTSNPGVVVSLLSPSGAEINKGNAASLGYVWTVISAADSAKIFTTRGTHISLRIPMTGVLGLYRVKADATEVPVDSEIRATSQSGVQFSLQANPSTLHTGESLTLISHLTRRLGAVKGATGSVSIVPLSNVNQGTIGDYRLVKRTLVHGDNWRYEYSARLISSGPAQPKVLATVNKNLPGVLWTDDVLEFANVPAGGSAPSVDTFTIVTKSNTPFNPANLTWQIQSVGTAVNIPIADGGADDPVAGDGVYTASFTPTVSGSYGAIATITGRTEYGPFARKAITRFRVSEPIARFVSFQEPPGTSILPDPLLTRVTLDVRRAGEYQLSMTLRASNGKTVGATANATLAVGTRQMTLAFPASAIAELGVNGPYQRINALLTRTEASGERVPAYSRPDAGSTRAYRIPAPDPGKVSLTGRSSSVGLVRTTGPLYDVLRVNVDVSASSSQECFWSAQLSDRDGVPIDSFSTSGPLAAGTSLIAFNFRGIKIAASRKNGPYFVRQLSMRCNGNQVPMPAVIQTEPFRFTQFISDVSDYSLSVTPLTLQVNGGASGFTGVVLSTPGRVTSTIELSASGLPPGVTSLFFPFRQMRVPGETMLLLQAAPGAPVGTFPVTVQAAGGGLVRSAKLNFQVAAPSPGYSVSASPLGAEFQVDGRTYHAARSFAWPAGSVHTLSVISPQAKLGSRHTFQNWSDGLAPKHQITAGETTNYVASFSTEYQLSIDVEPRGAGSVSPASDFYYPAGSSVNLTAIAKPGYQFESWSGGVASPSSASTSVLMATPKNLVATFRPLAAGLPPASK